MADNERGVYSTPGEPRGVVVRGILGGLLGVIVIGIPAILIAENVLNSRRRENPTVDQRAIRARVLARSGRMDPRVLARKREAI